MEVESEADRNDTLEVLFRFVAVYQQKEFVGQKAVHQDIEEVVGGNTCEEVLDAIWAKVNTWIKTEVIVEGDNFRFAEKEKPDRDDIPKFVILHDKAAKKNYSVSQLTSDILRKFRDKHIHVMIHIYGKDVSSKPIHQKMTAAILQPADRDRAGAHSTVTLTDLAKKLKKTHTYLSADKSAYIMWANAIHAAPAKKRDDMEKQLPPAHLVKLFRSVPTCEVERMRSTRQGLQVAGNLNDLYSENVKVLRQEFDKMKEHVFRSFELYDLRLKATEDMLAANGMLVDSMGSQLQVEENEVSLAEERQITDMEDIDHN